MRLRSIITALALLSAVAGSAEPVRTVLTADNTLYTIAAAGPSLTLARIAGETRQDIALPEASELTVDAEASLVWDSCSDLLFVVWHRQESGLSTVRLAALNGAGEWTGSWVIDQSYAAQAGVQITLTHGRQAGQEATLLHAAWWDLGEAPVAEYALVAFENGLHVSTHVASLEELAGALPVSAVSEPEDTGAAIHPPLALANARSAVDVAFGAVGTTELTRVKIEWRRAGGDARIWRPVGRTGERTGPARLIAPTSSPVQSFLTRDRLVLYTPGAQFRFIVHQEGQWTPIRTIELDGSLSTEQLLEALRRSVDEHSDAPQDEESGEPES